MSSTKLINELAIQRALDGVVPDDVRPIPEDDIAVADDVTGVADELDDSIAYDIANGVADDIPLVLANGLVLATGAAVILDKPELLNPINKKYYVAESVLEFIYVWVWSVAWYPQLITNFRQRTCNGFSYDLIAFNVYGFCFFTVFVSIQYMYQYHHGYTGGVDLGDVTFGVHSLLINCAYMMQAWYFDGRPFFSSLSTFCFWYILITSIVCLFHIGLAFFEVIPWVSLPGLSDEASWSVTEYMGAVKAIITVIKYIPQTLMNWDRKSTKGLNVWCFLFDTIGGICAILQNSVEALDEAEITYITGNIPKLLVASSSIIWDFIIYAQGVYLYGDVEPRPVAERASCDADSWVARTLSVFGPKPWPLEDVEELLRSNVDMDMEGDVELKGTALIF